MFFSLNLKCYGLAGNIFPGFIIPFGSNVLLIAFINSMLVSESSMPIYCFFVSPTPCSPDIPAAPANYWEIQPAHRRRAVAPPDPSSTQSAARRQRWVHQTEAMEFDSTTICLRRWAWRQAYRGAPVHFQLLRFEAVERYRNQRSLWGWRRTWAWALV